MYLNKQAWIGFFVTLMGVDFVGLVVLDSWFQFGKFGWFSRFTLVNEKISKKELTTSIMMAK